MTCELCGLWLGYGEEEWRVQVRNVDSISAGPLDVKVCRRCVDRVIDAFDALRKALV